MAHKALGVARILKGAKSALRWVMAAEVPSRDSGGVSRTTSEPDGTTSEPDGTTSEPDGTTSEPDGTTSEPDGTTSEPDGTTSEPDGTTSEPDGTTSKPDGTTSEPDGTTTQSEDNIRHGRLRFVVAFAIVLGAVSTAAAAWRAEIFTEYASQKEALFRQDLTGQQLYERLDEEQVAAGVRHFTGYEQDVLLASQLQREADVAKGKRATQLGVEAQNEQAAAAVRYTTDSALQSVAFTDRQGRPLADPAVGYAWTVLNDAALATFNPADRDADAQTARDDSVKMAGIAVLFALMVVLLTLSEIRLRRPAVTKQRWSDGHSLAVAGGSVWLIGAVFFVILIIDVFTLR